MLDRSLWSPPSEAAREAAVEPNWNADIGKFRGRMTGAFVLPPPDDGSDEELGESDKLDPLFAVLVALKPNGDLSLGKLRVCAGFL